MSSVFNPTETNHREFNAVNNVTICSGGTYTAHSNSDHRPWIKIDLQSVYDVQRVVIFNRQERFGRFVNKSKTIILGGQQATNMYLRHNAYFYC